MNFDFTEDQQTIKRTARDLLAARLKPERLRELAEGGKYDNELFAELVELGWPGIAVAEGHGGQGLGLVELVILQEELGYALAPMPFLSTTAAALLLEHAGSDEQRERWLAPLLDGSLRGTVGIVRNGRAALVPDAEGASFVVLVDAASGAARVHAADEVDVTPVEEIDMTRRFGAVAAGDGGDALAGDVAGGLDRAALALAAESVGIAQRMMEEAVAYAKDRRQFGQPIGVPPGGLAPLCADAARDRERTLVDLLRGLDRRPRAGVAAARGREREGLRLGRRRACDRVGAAGARWHRLHLGARPAVLPQARRG